MEKFPPLTFSKVLLSRSSLSLGTSHLGPALDPGRQLLSSMSQASSDPAPLLHLRPRIPDTSSWHSLNSSVVSSCHLCFRVLGSKPRRDPPLGPLPLPQTTMVRFTEASAHPRTPSSLETGPFLTSTARIAAPSCPLPGLGLPNRTGMLTQSWPSIQVLPEMTYATLKC